MAVTTFVVQNLNPQFRHTDGFFFDIGYDGGVNTQGTVDPADDVKVSANGTNGTDDRGIWIWCNGTPFDINGDAGDPATPAGIVNTYLETKGYTWLPGNPAYNTVAPLLKDGVTPNPDFDDSNNPPLADGSGLAQRTTDYVKHFDVASTVAVAAVADVEDEDGE